MCIQFVHVSPSYADWRCAWRAQSDYGGKALIRWEDTLTLFNVDLSVVSLDYSSNCAVFDPEVIDQNFVLLVHKSDGDDLQY